MSELTLVGLDDDGDHVVLEGSDGQRFRVRIDDTLRAAVRRDRPQLEQARAELAAVLPPREIQARIRAGASAEEVAEASGMPVEIVRRYDGPVLAERSYVAQQAQATRIGHDPGSPTLGDLVTDRLAARAVPPDAITWDSFRTGAAPWTVQVRFEAAGATRTARWSYDAPARRVRALDDEARWLSETELADEPIPRRHLAAVRDAVFDVEVDQVLRPLLAQVDVPPESEPTTPEDETHLLLDDLADRRGVRQDLDPTEDEDEQFAGFGPQHAFDFDNPELGVGPVPPAHPPVSRPEEAVDARVLRMPPARPEPAAGGTVADEGSVAATTDASEARAPEPGSGPSTDRQPAAEGPRDRDEAPGPPADAPRARGRRGRASVPSWDEIVFGAKNE